MIAIWMAYSTLIAACAGAVAAALEPILRARRLARRWIWGAAALVAVVLPIAVAVRPRPVVEMRFDAAASTGNSVVALPTAPVPSAAPLLDSLVLVAWALGSLLCGATLALGTWQLRLARRGARRTMLEGEIVALTADLGPGATPYGSPRILVPEWVRALDPGSVRLLLTHEREHVRAADPALLLCGVGALALMPWNAALWWCVRRLRAAIELDCDARVLQQQGDVRQYGELLIDVAERRSQPPLAALLTFADSTTPLERRITAMTESRRPLTRARLVTLGTVIAAALVIACETKRPAPLAPVTDFVLEDGVTRPRTQSGPILPAGESQPRFALGDAIARYFPDLAAKGGSDTPLMFVLDSANRVVEAKILGADPMGAAPHPAGRRGDAGALEGIAANASSVQPDAIQSVEVLKSRSLMPAGARGGVIVVRLKALPRTAQELNSATSGISQLLRTRPRTAVPPVGGDTQGVHFKQAAPGVGAAPLVEVWDHAGKLLFSKHVARSSGGGPMGDLPVDKDAIATVNVIKSPNDRTPGVESAIIRIVLKEGTGLKSAR